jgi:hypothetical protein
MIERHFSQALDEKLRPLVKVAKGFVEDVVRKSLSELLKKWQTSSDEEGLAAFYQEPPSGSSPPHLSTSPGPKTANSTESGSDCLPCLPWRCICEPSDSSDFNTGARQSLFPVEFDAGMWTPSAEPLLLEENGSEKACDGEHFVFGHHSFCNICLGFL